MPTDLHPRSKLSWLTESNAFLTSQKARLRGFNSLNVLDKLVLEMIQYHTEKKSVSRSEGRAFSKSAVSCRGELFL